MTPMTDAFNLLRKLSESEMARGLDRIAQESERRFEALQRKTGAAFDALTSPLPNKRSPQP